MRRRAGEFAEAKGYESVEVPVPVRPGRNDLDLILTPVPPAEQKTVAKAAAGAARLRP